MVGLLEDHVTRKKDLEYPPQELSEIDKLLIGSEAARLLIPLKGRYQVRQMMGVLRGLADRIDYLSRVHDMTDRTYLMTVRTDVREAQMQINEIAGKKSKRVIAEGRSRKA